MRPTRACCPSGRAAPPEKEPRSSSAEPRRRGAGSPNRAALPGAAAVRERGAGVLFLTPLTAAAVSERIPDEAPRCSFCSRLDVGDRRLVKDRLLLR